MSTCPHLKLGISLQWWLLVVISTSKVFLSLCFAFFFFFYLLAEESPSGYECFRFAQRSWFFFFFFLMFIETLTFGFSLGFFFSPLQVGLVQIYFLFDYDN
ncbi:hypothetical protein ACOSQ4_019104 [Xanthoceras sorbifolium]